MDIRIEQSNLRNRAGPCRLRPEIARQCMDVLLGDAGTGAPGGDVVDVAAGTSMMLQEGQVLCGLDVGKAKDLTGQVFGELTVLCRAPNRNGNGKGCVMWRCRCSCGRIKDINGSSLKQGRSRSCGRASLHSARSLGDLTGRVFGELTVVGQFLREGECTVCECQCSCGNSVVVEANRLLHWHMKSCGCKSSRLEDLTGQVFGKLTVTRRGENKGSHTAWECRCECGNVTVVDASHLTGGKTRSCGCSQFVGPNLIDVTGQRFGDLVVLRRALNQGREVAWECRCVCGKVVTVKSSKLRAGAVTSCGCKAPLGYEDLTGMVFCRLTVLGRDMDVVGRSPVWKCRCFCGNVVSVRTSSLKAGDVKSCGCLRRKAQDLAGMVIGELTVVRRLPNRGRYVMWECRCSCGKVVSVAASNLRRKDTQSCGHLAVEDLTGRVFSCLTVLCRAPNKGTAVAWKCRCVCGNVVDVRAAKLKAGHTKSCGCIKASFGEMFVERYLASHGYAYTSQQRFDDLIGPGGGHLSYDFAVWRGDQIEIVIEYQGQQHYGPVDAFGGAEAFALQLERDDMKRKYAETRGFRLIEIPYMCNTYERVANLLSGELVCDTEVA